MRRVLIGTIGYHNLRDFSIGPKLLPELQKIDWPPGVVVEEMNWGPIAIVQNFETLPDPYDRVIILTIRTGVRPAGEVTLWQWDGGLPDEKNLQDRIAEAVTGVISIDNLLTIGEYFKIWPEELYIVDVAPGIEEAGPDFTSEVEQVVPEVLELIYALAVNERAALPPSTRLRGDALPEA